MCKKGSPLQTAQMRWLTMAALGINHVIYAEQTFSDVLEYATENQLPLWAPPLKTWEMNQTSGGKLPGWQCAKRASAHAGGGVCCVSPPREDAHPASGLPAPAPAQLLLHAACVLTVITGSLKGSSPLNLRLSLHLAGSLHCH